ncbi:helix-turn-helix domain-containing protein [Roseivirga seohaensis]|uniref:helix-turn-helix domain-containing protein n=1 Tax=Roseivirga seohaensis TaxID=1914963 RepID=UPI003BAB3160
MPEQQTKSNVHVAFSDERISSIENQLKELIEMVRGIRPKTELPSMLTSDQVMEVLNIKRWKFDQLIADGELKYIRKSRKIYVYESSIKEYFGIN